MFNEIKDHGSATATTASQIINSLIYQNNSNNKDYSCYNSSIDQISAENRTTSATTATTTPPTRSKNHDEHFYNSNSKNNINQNINQTTTALNNTYEYDFIDKHLSQLDLSSSLSSFSQSSHNNVLQFQPSSISTSTPLKNPNQNPNQNLNQIQNHYPPQTTTDSQLLFPSSSSTSSTSSSPTSYYSGNNLNLNLINNNNNILKNNNYYYNTSHNNYNQNNCNNILSISPPSLRYKNNHQHNRHNSCNNNNNNNNNNPSSSSLLFPKSSQPQPPQSTTFYSQTTPNQYLQGTSTNPSFNLHINSTTTTTPTTTIQSMDNNNLCSTQGGTSSTTGTTMNQSQRPTDFVGNSFGIGSGLTSPNNSGGILTGLNSISNSLKSQMFQEQLSPNSSSQSSSNITATNNMKGSSGSPISTNSSPISTPTSPNSQPHQQQQQQQQQQSHQFQHSLQYHSSSLHSNSNLMQNSGFTSKGPNSGIGESVCSGGDFETNNNHSHLSLGGEPTYHFKTLVPAVASGAIIGKGGETIAALQKDAGARVKMSKSHDFYPGTTERVCLVTGSVEAIMTVLDFIMDKIREKPDLSTKIMDAEAKQAQERDKQVKILVPNSTAGMIIGKAGAYIKQVKEESGSYVQISQKPKDITLQERCITIIGDKENNKIACKMILSKIVEDPQSGTCLNVSYADVNGPVANYNPTGSPYATNQNAISSSTASLNSALGGAVPGATQGATGLLVNGTGINLSLNLGSPNPAPNLALVTQLLDHIKVAIRGSGYSENASNEVIAALGVLAKYGVLGVGVGLPHANGAHSAAAAAHNAAVSAGYLGALEQSAAAAANNVSLEQYFLNQHNNAAAALSAAAATRQTPLEAAAAAAAAQFDPFRHTGSQATAPISITTPISLNNNSFGLAAASNATTANAAQQQLSAAQSAALSALSKSPTPAEVGNKDSKNVEIPEVIVGAILGPNGRSLVEIQHLSGANIQISKKGIFAPGTRNRIVTITGQQNAIALAQYLIEQKINEEESKRARQNPLNNSNTNNSTTKME